MVLLLALACEEQLTPCERAALVAPTIELGTGGETFEPVADGDYLPVTFGPQGGFHVWGGVRTAGFDPGESALLAQYEVGVNLRFYMEIDDVIIADSGWLSRPMEGDEYEAELAGEAMFMEQWPYFGDGFETDQVEATYHVQIEDSCGNVGDAQTSVWVDVF